MLAFRDAVEEEKKNYSITREGKGGGRDVNGGIRFRVFAAIIDCDVCARRIAVHRGQ